MEFWFLICGASLSFIGSIFHGVVGQKKYMGNIYASDLPDLSKSLSLVSWHVFTIFLVMSSLTLIGVAFYENFHIATYPIIGINLFGTFLFILLGLGRHKILLTLPGAYLMGGTAFFAWMGL